MMRSALVSLAMAAAGALLVGCGETALTSLEDADGGLETQGTKKLNPELCSPDAGGFTLNSTNPYFPMDVGNQWFFEGDEGDATVTLLITVLNQTREIDGVTTRVIEEREWEDGELLEVS